MRFGGREWIGFGYGYGVDRLGMHFGARFCHEYPR